MHISTDLDYESRRVALFLLCSTLRSGKRYAGTQRRKSEDKSSCGYASEFWAVGEGQDREGRGRNKIQGHAEDSGDSGPGMFSGRTRGTRTLESRRSILRGVYRIVSTRERPGQAGIRRRETLSLVRRRFGAEIQHQAVELPLESKESTISSVALRRQSTESGLCEKKGSKIATATFRARFASTGESFTLQRTQHQASRAECRVGNYGGGKSSRSLGEVGARPPGLQAALGLVCTRLPGEQGQHKGTSIMKYPCARKSDTQAKKERVPSDDRAKCAKALGLVPPPRRPQNFLCRQISQEGTRSTPGYSGRRSP